MWGLLASTIVTSAVDSINPIGIVQQFVLQGLVKKPQHIWYFILPTGLTNLFVGYLVYYGFVTYLREYLDRLMELHGKSLVVVELLVGVAFLVAVGYIIWKRRCATHARQGLMEAEILYKDVDLDANRAYSVTPLALVGIGVGATLAELTSALPYFAFMAILFNYQLSFLQLTAIMVLYNLIYMAPFMVLYYVYIRSQEKFDSLYTIIRTQMTRWKNVITPLFISGIGLALMLHSMSQLLA
jgi:cytochrome c biogenesis protein CcdA